MRRFAAPLAVAVLAFAASCGIPEFDAPNIVESRRILAIRAEPREAAPGDTVTIEGLAVEKDGTPYVGPVAWIVTGSLDLNYGEADTPDELPAGEAYLQPPDGPPFTFTVPEGRDFVERLGEYDPAGTVLTIAMAIGDLNADPTIAIKSLIVSDAPVKQNPEFHEIRVIVEGKDVAPGEDGITPVGRAGQIKLVADVEFPTGGDATFHWYSATRGIDFNVEKATSWRLPKKAGLYDLYCVARENSETIVGKAGDIRIRSAGVDWERVTVEIADE
ncbi:hypothetical protein K8I61_07980 [bacterium]|nr:hypothetical protein [bacterium]